jgi:dTDP-4-amino-4,6-dideoxygalactose transaminase
VLLSAINIPDMAQIVRLHGLVPIPLDVDAATLLPNAEAVRTLISPRARVLLVAHLFGSHGTLDEIAAIAGEHNLLLVEDCAQAFAGRGFTGHPASDVVLFSFGPIKTATALGGAVLRIRNPELLRRMYTRQAEYPRQSSWRYFRRVLKAAGLKLLSTRPLYSSFVRGCRMLGRDHDRFIRGSLRSFGDGADLRRVLRFRPAEPLVRVLRRRIRQFDDQELLARTANAERLAAGLSGRGAAPLPPRPGDTFWVFPYRSSDPKHLAEHLLTHGFDIARQSSLVAVEPPGTPYPAPNTARELIRTLVFLPAYMEIPHHEIDRLAELVASFQAEETSTAAKRLGNTTNSEDVNERVEQLRSSAHRSLG